MSANTLNWSGTFTSKGIAGQNKAGETDGGGRAEGSILVEAGTIVSQGSFSVSGGVTGGSGGSGGSGRYAINELGAPGLTPTPTPDPQPTPEAPSPGWVAHEYNYDADQPHAVSSVARNSGKSNEYTDTFTYDANGNMTCRVENGTTWRQSYNAENRLFKVEEMDGDCDTGTAGDTWTFYYDGDGARVKEVYDDGPSGSEDYTKLFLGGGVYNVENPGASEVVTTYFSVEGQRVAMRDSAGTQFLITDHLGSIVAVTDTNGDLVDASEERFTAFGSSRQSASPPTDFGYTGQRSNSYIKLIDYGARWYDPSLGRFTQPDTIVPELSSPQSLNHFAYVENNPLVYTDPSGHRMCETNDFDDCHHAPEKPRPPVKDPAIDYDESKTSGENWRRLEGDPIELLARIILAEEGNKFYHNEAIDAYWAGWVLKNRLEEWYCGEGKIHGQICGSEAIFKAFTGGIEAVGTIELTKAAFDPIGNYTYFGISPEDAEFAYEHAINMAEQIWEADISDDPTGGADQYSDAWGPKTDPHPWDRTHFWDQTIQVDGEWVRTNHSPAEGWCANGVSSEQCFAGYP